MKRVCLLSDFYAADPSYSLCIVAEEMLGMLAGNGYSPVAIAEDIFQPVRNWKLAEMRSIPSGIPRDNHIMFYDKNEVQVRGKPHPYSWEDDVRRIRESLDVALDGIDVVLTHDLIYQATNIWINMAARQYAKDHPDVVWLNWIHSATASPIWTSKDERLAPLQVHMPNSKTVYPNEFDRLRVARAFNCELDDVAVVPHSTDIRSFLGIRDDTAKLVESKRLLDCDVLMIYPIRLDRGKQVEYVIRTAAAIKKNRRSARVVVVDFHSTAGDKVKYRHELKELAIDLGLSSHEVTFTSEFCDEWHVSVPREMVRDLFLLSNVYVHPSKSETYSLTTQEAALCGNFLVLNYDFPAMRSIYGHHAAFYKFSSNVNIETGEEGETATSYGSIDAYFHDIALRIAYELDNNHVLAQKTRIRKERGPNFVFKKYIEPLFCFN